MVSREWYGLQANYVTTAFCHRDSTTIFLWFFFNLTRLTPQLATEPHSQAAWTPACLQSHRAAHLVLWPDRRSRWFLASSPERDFKPHLLCEKCTVVTLLCYSHWLEHYCHGNLCCVLLVCVCVCNTLQWGGTDYRVSQEQHSAGLILPPTLLSSLIPPPIAPLLSPSPLNLHPCQPLIRPNALQNREQRPWVWTGQEITRVDPVSTPSRVYCVTTWSRETNCISLNTHMCKKKKKKNAKQVLISFFSLENMTNTPCSNDVLPVGSCFYNSTKFRSLLF